MLVSWTRCGWCAHQQGLVPNRGSTRSQGRRGFLNSAIWTKHPSGLTSWLEETSFLVIATPRHNSQNVAMHRHSCPQRNRRIFWLLAMRLETWEWTPARQGLCVEKQPGISEAKYFVESRGWGEEEGSWSRAVYHPDLI